MPIGRVLCLGGALTVGLDSEVSGYRTFRGSLQNALATAGLTLDFIGPNSNAAAAGGNDANHAGWIDASIDATGSSTNNLTSRLSALKADFPSPDLIIIDPPWWDIVNAPTNLATRYSTFIGAVQSGAWASVGIVMCTAHPASGQTAAQTAGAYAAYSAVNAAMATLRNASPTTRFIADLAALQTTSGGTSAALTERALWMAQKAPDFGTLEGGAQAANAMGGHFVGNWKGVVDFNAGWTSNIPRNADGSMTYPPPGGVDLINWNVDSWNGSVNRFLQSAAGITPWYWIYCLEGHNASNTCVEVRNGFAAALRPNGGGWRFLFSGSRFGDTGTFWNGERAVRSSVDSRSRWGQRSDGLTTWHAPRGNVGIEVWPRDTIPSRGIVEFNGGFNRDLIVGSLCWWWGAQCRLALIDPQGPDDRSRARFGVKCGGDLASSLPYAGHYDRYGWPYTLQDIGSDAWTRVTWTDWEMVSAITLGREGSPSSGSHPEYHWNDQGSAGPMFGWSPPSAFNDPSAGRSLTASQIRQNPLPVPPHWEGGSTSGGTTVSGYQVTDYWQPSGGSRLYLLMQSGADKIASIMSSAIVASGALSSFTGGGVTFELMPGLATRPNVFPKVNGAAKRNIEPKNRTTTVAPVWPTTALPAAIVGAAYIAPVAAVGDPAPTYTILSGAPAWLSLLQGATRNRLRTVGTAGAALGVIGSGGALPAFWGRATVAGVAYQVVGIGALGGVPYIDIRISGTPTVTGSWQLYLDDFSIVAASGQTWTASVSAAIIAGALTNTSAALECLGTTAAGAFTESSSTPISGGTLTRYTRPCTLNAGTTARVTLQLSGSVTNGQQIGGAAAGFTIRLTMPQLEQAAAATTWVDPAVSYLVGTPTGGDASHSVSLRAANGVSPDADIVLELQVYTASVVTTSSLPPARIGQPYFARLEAAGLGPFAWTLTGASLWTGLELAGDTITGTPTAQATGSRSYTATATGPTGAQATRSLTLDLLAAAGVGPAWVTASLPGATVGAPLVTSVSATGATGYSVTFFTGTGTPTITAGGSLTIPAQSLAGTYTITLRATNAGGFTSDRTFTVSVTSASADPAPVRTWIGPDGGGVSWQRSR